jgi:hypothetical protein
LEEPLDGESGLVRIDQGVVNQPEHIFYSMNQPARKAIVEQSIPLDRFVGNLDPKEQQFARHMIDAIQ